MVWTTAQIEPVFSFLFWLYLFSEWRATAVPPLLYENYVVLYTMGAFGWPHMAGPGCRDARHMRLDACV